LPAGHEVDHIKSPFSPGEKITSFNDVTHYNNFYDSVSTKATRQEL